MSHLFPPFNPRIESMGGRQASGGPRPSLPGGIVPDVGREKRHETDG